MEDAVRLGQPPICVAAMPVAAVTPTAVPKESVYTPRRYWMIWLSRNDCSARAQPCHTAKRIGAAQSDTRAPQMLFSRHQGCQSTYLACASVPGEEHILTLLYQVQYFPLHVMNSIAMCSESCKDPFGALFLACHARCGSPAQEQALGSWLHQHLAGWRGPACFAQVPPLPRTACLIRVTPCRTYKLFLESLS